MTLLPDARKRLWSAVLFSAPATGGLIGLVWGLVYMTLAIGNLTPQFPAQGILIVLLGALIGFVIGLPLTIIVGLPIHAFLIRQSRVSAIAYLLMGTAAGVLLGLMASFIQSDEVGFYRIISLVLFGIGSPLTAYIFWLIRRPDRDAPPAHMPQPPAT